MQQRRCRFGVSEFTTWPWSFERDLAQYASLGILDVEVAAFKLDRERYADQLALLVDSGFGIASVQPTIHALFPTKLQPEPTDPGDRMRHIRRSIERFAGRVPEGTPIVTITGSAPGGDVQTVIETATRRFKELARVAADCGVRLAFEPLNPTLMNIDTAVSSLDAALAIVEEVDEPAFGLCVDTWNIWQTRELDACLHRAGDRIFVVQVSDWRTPHSLYDRLPIGRGEIPFVELIASIHDAGYDGPYVLEIFSSESLVDSLWRSDLLSVIRESARAFERAWTAALTRAADPLFT